MSRDSSSFPSLALTPHPRGINSQRSCNRAVKDGEPRRDSNLKRNFMRSSITRERRVCRRSRATQMELGNEWGRHKALLTKTPTARSHSIRPQSRNKAPYNWEWTRVRKYLRREKWLAHFMSRMIWPVALAALSSRSLIRFVCATSSRKQSISKPR